MSASHPKPQATPPPKTTPKKFNSRKKGATFERDVAAAIIEAGRGLDLTKKDCYRTPLSGGHPFGDPGDLVIAPVLYAFFPFSVECKSHRNWTPGVMFDGRAQESAWFDQVVKASGKRHYPLLVMGGIRTGMYAALREDDYLRYADGVLRFPLLTLKREDASLWVVLPFPNLLRALTVRVKKNKPMKPRD